MGVNSAQGPRPLQLGPWMVLKLDAAHERGALRSQVFYSLLEVPGVEAVTDLACISMPTLVAMIGGTPVQPSRGGRVRPVRHKRG